jgi:hypothetical protein
VLKPGLPGGDAGDRKSMRARHKTHTETLRTLAFPHGAFII